MRRRLRGQLELPLARGGSLAGGGALPPWRAPLGARVLLASSDPREVLAAIVPRDPLDLRALVAERLDARCLVLDAGAVQLASAVRLARARRGGSEGAAARGAGRRGSLWISGEVDAAITAASVEPAECGGASVQSVLRAFAHRPLAERRVFSDVALARREPEDVARKLGLDLGTIARIVNGVLESAERAVRRASSREGSERSALDVLRQVHAARRGPHACFELKEALALLARTDAEELARAVRSALGHLVASLLPGDSHLDVAPRDEGPFAAWRSIEALASSRRDARLALDLAAPREFAAARLAEVLGGSLGVSAEEARLWRVRVEAARRDPRESAAAALEIARDAAAPERVRAAAIRDAVALSLDALDPAAALAAAGGASGEPRDRALEELVAIAADALAPAPRIDACGAGERAGSRHEGDSAGSRGEAREGGDPRGGGRARASARSDTRERGQGRQRAARARAGRPARARDPHRRSAFGASVRLVVRLARGTDGELRAECLDGDVDPALDRGAAIEAPFGELQRRACASARSEVCDASSASDSLLDPTAMRIAVEPVLDAHGEVAGWVHVEWRHRMSVPVEALAALAAASIARVLSPPPLRAALLDVAARGGAVVGSPASSLAGSLGGGHVGSLGETCGDSHGGARASLARELVERLGFGTAQRSWAFFAVRARSPVPLLEPLASGGAGALVQRDVAAAAGIARAATVQGAVELGSDPERLALHAEAASGFAVHVPGSWGEGYVLAVESAKRGDLSAGDGRRLAARLAPDGWRLDLAAVADRDGGLGAGAAWLGDEPALETFARELFLAARARGPCAVFGPPGSGRRTLARWLHHAGELESRAGSGAVAPVALDDPVRASDLCPNEGAGTLVALGLERLDSARQVDWLARRALAAGDPRWIVVLPAAPRALAAEGRLAAEVAAQLSRRAIGLPALADVRQRIPALAGSLLARLSREAGIREAALDDGALALLFRGAWPCNVADLEAVLGRLVDESAPRPRATFDASDVERAIVRVGLDPVARLASRHPRAGDVAAALWCTRTAGGRCNKTRAAAWLGWDTETLAARMREAELADAADVQRRLAEG